MQLSDPASERAVLAGICAYGGDAYLDTVDMLTNRTFTIDSNQAIFRCLEQILKNSPEGKVDYPSILAASKSIGLGDFFDKPEERDHLRAVMNMPVRQETVGRLAGLIRKLEVARLLNQQLEEAKNNIEGITGDESIDQILSMAHGPIFDFSSLLASEQSSGPRLMGVGAREYVQFLMDNPREMMGISTGMPHYDFSLGGGLRVNSLDIIAARPKQGKTQIVDNVGVHIAGKIGVPVFNLDTEMTWEEHLHRIIGNLAGVEVRDIETGKCSLKEISKQKVLEAADRLKDMPYHYECIIGKQFDEVLASMRKWVTRTVGLDSNGKAKPCVIIYDYLKLMSADFLSGDIKEYQALGFITTAIKNFMGRFSVPCLCFAQLNRDGIDREDTDAISGSDRIIHYCTSFTIYKKKTDDERAEAGAEASKYTHKLVPIISRHGEDLDEGDYINVQADYRHGRIVEGPTRNGLAKGVGKRQQRGIISDESQDQIVDFGQPLL